ncbi:MAG: hypothetical protein R3292_01695 [Alcanivorax sp.]|nr:hypothetical protein [Alcanivorax sp.]
MTTSLFVWALLCALSFAIGLVWSWRRWRRRLRERMTTVIDEEICRQLAREVLRQLQQGPRSQ